MKHILTLITALLLLPLTVLQAADATKPNVLFIIADDLGWGDLRCYGNQVVDTPTLDELAKTGVRFFVFTKGGCTHRLGTTKGARTPTQRKLGFA